MIPPELTLPITICAAVASTCWLLSLVFREYSWVDRLWSIVPPISGGLTPVFHRYYDEPTDTGPMFRLDDQAAARGQGCPV